MVAFVQGQAVTQILPAPIQGVVESFAFDPKTANITVLVSYKDAEGNTQQRYFNQSELEVVPASAPAA